MGQTCAAVILKEEAMSKIQETPSLPYSHVGRTRQRQMGEGQKIDQTFGTYCLSFSPGLGLVLAGDWCNCACWSPASLCHESHSAAPPRPSSVWGLLHNNAAHLAQSLPLMPVLPCTKASQTQRCDSSQQSIPPFPERNKSHFSEIKRSHKVAVTLIIEPWTSQAAPSGTAWP